MKKERQGTERYDKEKERKGRKKEGKRIENYEQNREGRWKIKGMKKINRNEEKLRDVKEREMRGKKRNEKINMKQETRYENKSER